MWGVMCDIGWTQTQAVSRPCLSPLENGKSCQENPERLKGRGMGYRHCYRKLLCNEREWSVFKKEVYKCHGNNQQ